jgi:hypothetical protein
VGWFWNTEHGGVEATELRERFPSLELKLDIAKREAVAVGVLPLSSDVGYQLTIQIPPGYPEEVPTLHCLPEEIPKKDFRHNSGESACLCARCDYRKHWPRGSSLADFVQSLVIPFLTCQHYFDIHGYWPKTGEREHGAPGIVQAYSEFCRPLGDVTGEMIGRIVRMLIRSGLPKGHNSCPCGSGKRIRDCHRLELEQMRRMISPCDAAKDLADLLRK